MSGQLIDDYPLIEPGIYTLAYVEHRTFLYHGKVPKLLVRFRVTDLCSANGKEVTRFYNVARLRGRTGKGGRFQVRRNHDFTREWFNVFDVRARLDRFPVQTQFSREQVRGEVVTVEQDHRQREIAEPLRYSRISRLIEIVPR